MALSNSAFPSPAAEYLEPVLDLQQYVVKNPAATFFARALNDFSCGVFQGDILVIDRAAKPEPGNIALLIREGRFSLERLTAGKAPYTLWGVVIYVLHKTK